MKRAAPDFHAVLADRPDGGGPVQAAFGVVRPALVGAVAVGPESAHQLRSDEVGVPPLRAVALALSDAQATLPQ